MILSDLFPIFKILSVGDKKNEILERIREPIKPAFTLEQITKDTEHSDSSQLVDIKLKNGVVYSYYAGLAEPVLGQPQQEIVQIVSVYKRLFILLVASLARQNIIGKVITALAVMFNTDAIIDWFEMIFQTYPIRLKEQYYLPAVKEIRRVMLPRMRKNYVDAITAIIENDNAYRHRLQDILPLLDKTQLKGYKRTTREIRRLISILIERDVKQQGQITKYQSLYKITFLLIIPKIRKIVIDILMDLDLDKLKMSKEDIYFTNRYMVYKCRGLDRETRQQENINKYGVK